MDHIALSEIFEGLEQDKKEISVLIEKRHWVTRYGMKMFGDPVLAILTDEELVDFFLELHESWFTNPSNDMYGLENYVRKEIQRVLRETEKLIQHEYHDLNHDPMLNYAYNKFCEFFGPDGIFLEYK